MNNLFVATYEDTAYVVRNVDPSRATLRDVVRVFTRSADGDGFADKAREWAADEMAHHAGRVLRESSFVTLPAGSVMGCDADIAVGASHSLDEDPVLALRSAAGEFPAIYAPNMSSWEAELLLGLLEGAPEDSFEGANLRRKLLTVLEARNSGVMGSP